jgi:hypothetical protein
MDYQGDAIRLGQITGADRELVISALDRQTRFYVTGNTGVSAHACDKSNRNDAARSRAKAVDIILFAPKLFRVKVSILTGGSSFPSALARKSRLSTWAMEYG